MPIVTANNISIECESHGADDAPAVVMIMGLASQLIMWPPALISAIVDAGFRVVTFDNRDIGLSQKFHGQRAPNPISQVALARLGVKRRVPYTLHDMVADTAGVLDELGIERAHIVGASMGGMIGQLFASAHPQRTLSLVSIMSTTNNPALPRPDSKVTGPILLNRRKSKTRDEMVDNALAAWAMIGTPDPDVDPAILKDRIGASFDRCYYPAGVRRQVAAIIATGDLRAHVRKITSPTLVIHGSIDPLVPIEGGRDSARNIDGAEMAIIEGMAHDLPAKHIPRITQLIVDHARSADESTSLATPS